MTDAERYAITVRRVRIEDEEMWRATVRELPDVAEYADSREEAIALVLDTIESLKADAQSEGREFPEPMEDDDEYSGRIMVRLPKSVHRSVAMQANEEGVSLNSYVITSLTWSVAQRLKAVPMSAKAMHAYDKDIIKNVARPARASMHAAIVKLKIFEAAAVTAAAASSAYYGIPGVPVGAGSGMHVLTEHGSITTGTGTGGFYSTTVVTGNPEIDPRLTRVFQDSDERLVVCAN